MLVLRAIATGDRKGASALIEGSPHLARASASVGASRRTSTSYFFAGIGHYVYAGDTALHIAAAAYRSDIASDLIAHGASPAARNRRGAEPLHYAAAGMPGSAHWNPKAQAGHDRVPDSIGIQSELDRQERDGSAASSGSHALRGGCPGAAGAWRQSPAQERQRLDAAPPRRSEHRTRRQRYRGGERAASGDYPFARGARRPVDG